MKFKIMHEIIMLIRIVSFQSKMRLKVDQLPSDCNESVSHKDEIFYEVLGPDKHGHCRAYGHGPSPTDVHGTKHPKVNEKEYERLRSEIRSEF